MTWFTKTGKFVDWRVYSQPKTAMPYILLAVCNILFPDVMISRWGGEFGTTLRAAQDVAKTAQSKGFVAELKTLDEVRRQLWDVSSISCSVNVFMVLHACWATGNDSWNDLFVRTATYHPLQLNSHPTKQLTQSWSCFVPQPARYHPKILYLVRSRPCGCNSSALTWWLICWDNGLEPRIDGQIPFVLVMVATHLWWHFSCAVVVDTGIHDMAKPKYNGHPPELLGVILLKKCCCSVWVCYKMFFFPICLLLWLQAHAIILTVAWALQDIRLNSIDQCDQGTLQTFARRWQSSLMTEKVGPSTQLLGMNV